VAPEVAKEEDLPMDESMNDELGANHEEAISSGENGINNDVEMGIVIYRISADRDLQKKAIEWEQKYELEVDKKWNEDIHEMNDALSKEGFDHGIIEVYSPKRVTGIGELMGLIPGMALDLSENYVGGIPWDFNNPEKRARAENLVMSKTAFLLIGSPMCSAFSQIQGLSLAE